MRIPFIAGNWKMYKNIKEAVEFAAIFAPLYHDTDVRTAIFAPFPQLGPLADAFRGTGIGELTTVWLDILRDASILEKPMKLSTKS